MRPNWRFLLAHPSHFLALGFGAGLSPWAPGTVGSLLAWLLYPLISVPLPEWGLLLLLPCLFVVGMPACERAGLALGKADHGGIVWDEMVAVWLVLALCPPSLLWQTGGVILFRFFDIVKPQPVGWVDRRLKSGFGVMLDDLMAAGYTLLCLAIGVRFCKLLELHCLP